jgi:DNA-binding protein YbaB
MLQGISNLMGMMKNAQQLQAEAAKMQVRLKDVRVSASSPDGQLTAVVSGDQRLISLEIAPDRLAVAGVEPDAAAELEQGIVTTVNQALVLAREAAAREMSNLAEGMGVPGMQEMLARLGQGS